MNFKVKQGNNRENYIGSIQILEISREILIFYFDGVGKTQIDVSRGLEAIIHFIF